MKTLIYQYWYGKEMPNGAKYGKKVMSEYAKRIDAEYRFDKDPTFFEGFVEQPVSYTALMPVFNEEFHEYDAVLVVDMDVYPIEGLEENIFGTDFGEMALCQETHMPFLKKKYRPLNSDSPRSYQAHEDWSSRMKKNYGKDMPKNSEGLYKIFNSGVVLYSKEGMKKAKAGFVHPQEFVNQFKPHFGPVLFWRDQAYVHALFTVAGLDTYELDIGWNSLIQWVPPMPGSTKKEERKILDCRPENAKFIHAQLNGASNWSEEDLWKLTNAPDQMNYKFAKPDELELT